MLKTIKNTMTEQTETFFILHETENEFSAISELYYYYLLNKYQSVSNFPDDIRTNIFLKNSYEILGIRPLNMDRFKFLSSLDVERFETNPYFVFSLINDFISYKAESDSESIQNSCYFKALYTYKKYINLFDRFMLLYLIDYLCLSFHTKDEFENYLKIQNQKLC